MRRDERPGGCVTDGATARRPWACGRRLVGLFYSGAVRRWSVGWILIFVSLLPAFALAGGNEVAPLTCVVVLVDRQAPSWVGGGQGRTSHAAREEAIRNTCDSLPGKERTLCRQQAPMGKWVDTTRKGGDPARPGRATYYHHVDIEIFRPRSRIRAVGNTAGPLAAGPPLEATEGFARACQRAIDEGCRLLGAEATPGFASLAGQVTSKPCVGVDWFLGERTPGTPGDTEGAAFTSEATPKAPVPSVPTRTRLQSDERVAPVGRSRVGGWTRYR